MGLSCHERKRMDDERSQGDLLRCFECALVVDADILEAKVSSAGQRPFFSLEAFSRRSEAMLRPFDPTDELTIGGFRPNIEANFSNVVALFHGPTPPWGFLECKW